MTELNTRWLACKAVAPILSPNKKSPSLDQQILKSLPKLNALQNQSFFKSLCFNMCRWHNQLTAISQLLLKKPLKKNAFDVQLSINIGLLQLFYLDVDDHAAIKESVEIASLIKKPWAKGLINAVLRKAQRLGKKQLLSQIQSDMNIKYAHPDWITNIILQDWPDQADEILSNNNTPGPLTLRVNINNISRENYSTILKDAKIDHFLTSSSPYGITLKTPCPVDQIPLFKEGTVTVQDEAAQLAAHLLEPKPSETILDACAAPGSKSTHLWELSPESQLISNDINKDRLLQVGDNFKRLGITAKITCMDLIKFKKSEPDLAGHISSILLDVPCSGLGVIRRHPDIKWLRKESDIDALTKTQNELLRAAWALLTPGGKLLYCSCSIVRAENEQIITQFIDTTPSAQLIELKIANTISTQVGLYLLPSKGGHDGFYFSLLQKGA